ncbi:MAG: hypothetical protein R3D67_17985 [Hyphomicrobiaceae bacterium]
MKGDEWVASRVTEGAVGHLPSIGKLDGAVAPGQIEGHRVDARLGLLWVAPHA